MSLRPWNHLLPALLLALTTTCPTASAQSQAAGWFQHGERRVELDHGIALRLSDAQAGGRSSLVLLLAESPPDAELGRGKRNPLGNIEAGLPFDSARLLLYVDDSKVPPVLERLSFAGLMALSPGGDTLQLANGRIRGSWEVPADATDGRWQSALSIDLPVLDLDGGD